MSARVFEGLVVMGGSGGLLVRRAAVRVVVSGVVVMIPCMPDYRWAPPSHLDPPDDQPLGVPAPPAPDRVSGYPAVWVAVDFTRSGPQTCPGFVEQADGDVAYVQLVHMGFAHHLWVPISRLTKRVVRPDRRR